MFVVNNCWRGPQAVWAPVVRWSSCEIRVGNINMWLTQFIYKGHGTIIRACMGMFSTALRNLKNIVKFSIKILHFTSTVHRFLSYRLLCWKKTILASYPFLGLLRIWERSFSYAGTLGFEPRWAATQWKLLHCNLSLAPIGLRKLFSSFQHWFYRKMLEG